MKMSRKRVFTIAALAALILPVLAAIPGFGFKGAERGGKTALAALPDGAVMVAPAQTGRNGGAGNGFYDGLGFMGTGYNYNNFDGLEFNTGVQRALPLNVGGAERSFILHKGLDTHGRMYMVWGSGVDGRGFGANAKSVYDSGKGAFSFYFALFGREGSQDLLFDGGEGITFAVSSRHDNYSVQGDVKCASVKMDSAEFVKDIWYKVTVPMSAMTINQGYDFEKILYVGLYGHSTWDSELRGAKIFISDIIAEESEEDDVLIDAVAGPDTAAVAAIPFINDSTVLGTLAARDNGYGASLPIGQPASSPINDNKGVRKFTVGGAEKDFYYAGKDETGNVSMFWGSSLTEAVHEETVGNTLNLDNTSGDKAVRFYAYVETEGCWDAGINFSGRNVADFKMQDFVQFANASLAPNTYYGNYSVSINANKQKWMKYTIRLSDFLLYNNYDFSKVNLVNFYVDSAEYLLISDIDIVTASRSSAEETAGAVPDLTASAAKLDLTITPKAQSVQYGTAPSQTEYSVSGALANTPHSLTGAPVITGDVTAVGATGTVTLALGNLSDSEENYNIVLGTATADLTITKKELMVTASAQTITYGGAISQAQYVVTGFVNSDGATVITGAPVLTATGTAAGGHTINISVTGMSADNYFFTGVTGALTINKAVLTVNAKNQTITFGSLPSLVEYELTGFVGGDTAASVTVTGTPTLTAGGTSVGTHAVIVTSVSGMSAANYTFAAGVAGQLTVNKANGSGSLQIADVTAGTDINPVAVSVTNGNTPAIYYKLMDASDETYTTDVPKAAGKYTAKAVFAATASYNEVTVKADFEITAASENGGGGCKKNSDGGSALGVLFVLAAMFVVKKRA